MCRLSYGDGYRYYSGLVYRTGRTVFLFLRFRFPCLDLYRIVKVENHMDPGRERYLARSYARRQTLSGAAAAAVLTNLNHSVGMAGLLRLLADSDPAVRENAIRNLAASRQRGAIEAIARCINDRDVRVRTAACRALGELRAHQFKAKLYDALGDKDAGVRCTAAAALGRMGDKYGLPFVAKLVTVRGRHQYQAVRALNSITGEKFPVNDHGLSAAIRWVKSHRRYLRRL